MGTCQSSEPQITDPLPSRQWTPLTDLCRPYLRVGDLIMEKASQRVFTISDIEKNGWVWTLTEKLSTSASEDSRYFKREDSRKIEREASVIRQYNTLMTLGVFLWSPSSDQFEVIGKVRIVNPPEYVTPSLH